MERKQTRYSLSIGNIKHLAVGNFADLSLHIITLLYKHSNYQDYEHVARQLGLNGGTVALHGYECQNLIQEYRRTEESKVEDINVIGAIANSFDSLFCLKVFSAHEERQILQDAFDDLQLDIVGARGDIERAENILKQAKDRHDTLVRLGERLQEKINLAKE